MVTTLREVARKKERRRHENYEGIQPCSGSILTTEQVERLRLATHTLPTRIKVMADSERLVVNGLPFTSVCESQEVSLCIAEAKRALRKNAIVCDDYGYWVVLQDEDGEREVYQLLPNALSDDEQVISAGSPLGVAIIRFIHPSVVDVIEALRAEVPAGLVLPKLLKPMSVTQTKFTLLAIAKQKDELQSLISC